MMYWIKIGKLQMKPATIRRYIGEGIYEMIDERGVIRYSLITEMEPINYERKT